MICRWRKDTETAPLYQAPERGLSLSIDGKKHGLSGAADPHQKRRPCRRIAGLQRLIGILQGGDPLKSHLDDDVALAQLAEAWPVRRHGVHQHPFDTARNAIAPARIVIDGFSRYRLSLGVLRRCFL